MPDRGKPTHCVLFWKYENEAERQFREVSEYKLDYANDADGAIDGIQNIARIIGADYNRAAEVINVALCPQYIDGSRESMRWMTTATTVTMGDAGGIDSSEQTVDVLKPANGTFAVGDYARIGSEWVRISSITEDTPDISHDRWTIVRALHGSSGAAHANGTVFRKYAYSVALGHKALSGVTEGLPAPSSVVVQGMRLALRFTWEANLSEEEYKRLDTFVAFWKQGSTMNGGSSWDPNEDPLPAGVTMERWTKETVKVWQQDDTSNSYFFRLAALDTSGNYSALSEEVNAKALSDAGGSVPPSADTPLAPEILPASTGATASHYMFTLGIDVAAGDPSAASIQEVEVVWGPSSGFDPDTAPYSMSLHGAPPHRTSIQGPKEDGRLWKFAARCFNPNADPQWGPWSTEEERSASNRNPVTGPPDGFAFYATTPTKVGHAVTLSGVADHIYPTLWGWHILLATSKTKLTNPGFFDRTGLANILIGDISVTVDVGGYVVHHDSVDFLAAGVQSGHFLAIYKGSVVGSNGTWLYPSIHKIKTVAQNDIELDPDASFDRTPDEGDTLTQVDRRITIGTRSATLSQDGFRILLRTHIGAGPASEIAWEDDIPISQDLYIAASWADEYGYGPWMCWNGGSGSLDMNDAVVFSPSLIQAGSYDPASVDARTLSGSARSQHGVCLIDFEDDDPSDWIFYRGDAGDVEILDAEGMTGGKVLHMTSPGAYVATVFPIYLPYVASKIYRIRIRVKQLVDGAAYVPPDEPRWNVGVACLENDKVTHINRGGTQAWDNNYNPCMYHQSTEIADGWVEFTGWFSGYGATPVMPAPSALDPCPLPTGTSYILPTLEWTNTVGGEVYADYIAMDVFDEEEIARLYNAIDENYQVDLDNNVKDGVTYARTASSALDENGLVVMSSVTGTLDDVDNGTVYSKVLKTHVSAGKIQLLSETVVDAGFTLDKIPDGSSYGKILKTDISSGHILLSSVQQSSSYRTVTDSDINFWDAGTMYIGNSAPASDIPWLDTSDIPYVLKRKNSSSPYDWVPASPRDMDDIADGTNYGKIYLTDIESGHIRLSGDGYIDLNSAVGIKTYDSSGHALTTIATTGADAGFIVLAAHDTYPGRIRFGTVADIYSDATQSTNSKGCHINPQSSGKTLYLGDTSNSWDYITLKASTRINISSGEVRIMGEHYISLDPDNQTISCSGLTDGRLILGGTTGSFVPGVTLYDQIGGNVRFAVTAAGVGFNGQTAMAAPNYTVSNGSPDRSFDASSADLAELRNVVGTIVADLISYGLFQ